MGRGWRVLALVAMAGALCGEAPKPAAKADQEKSQRQQAKPTPSPPLTTKPVEPIQPPEYYRPCDSDGKNGHSDLCAQWTAAQGARDAAYWAKMSFWFGLLGLGGLLWTLYYTRKAVLAAEEATQDADQALAHAAEGNEIARSTAQRELRAYVIAKDHAVCGIHTGWNMTFRVKIENFGQTPASELRFRTLVRATTGDVDEYRMMFRGAREKGTFSNAIIGPGDFHVHENTMEAPLDEATCGQIYSGDMKLIFAGIISYLDVFGKRHLTTFKYLLIPPEGMYSPSKMIDLGACGTGNKAN